jgi:hypothetical protein
VLTTNNFSNLVGTPACADDIVIVVTAGYCKILRPFGLFTATSSALSSDYATD